MKHVIFCIVLSIVGYATISVWQELITYALEENGCQLVITEISGLSKDRILGALAFLGCYPLSLLSVAGVSMFGMRKWRQQELYAVLMAAFVGGNLGGLLRAMIIVKIQLQDAFANGETTPMINAATLDTTLWVVYGLLSGILLCTIILVPLGLLEEAET